MRDAGKEVDWQAPSSRYHLGVDQVDQESVDGDPQLKEIELKVTKWAYFKDTTHYIPPPYERKMTSLLHDTMTSLLLILTPFGRPPSPPPGLRSSLIEFAVLAIA